MSWSRPTRRLWLVGALLLSACGYVPAYGPGGAGTALRGAVAISAPDTVDGYHLLTRIQDRLGRTDAARWHLTLTLDVTETAAAIGSDGTISRNTLTGAAIWRLTDPTGTTVVGQGTARALTGYGTGSSNTVAIRAAELDARDRLARILADSIVTQLIALDLGG